MRILLTGGAASGKSAYALCLARSLPGPRYYIAAMRPYDIGSGRSIVRHRAARRELGFSDTIERYTDLAGLKMPERGTALLECLCNLADNEMAQTAGGDSDETILHGLEAVSQQCMHLIVVTNDVGSGMPVRQPAVLRYLKTMGRLNTQAVARFDAVLELVCGIPITVKGDLWENMPPMEMPEKKGTDLVLVVGAAAAGKRRYVEGLGYADADMAEAVLDTRPVLLHLERLVAAAPERVEEWLPLLLQKRVIVCDEIGGGIIPASSEQRRIRRQTGRLCILLAQRAARVVRVMCGLPTVLKG